MAAFSRGEAFSQLHARLYLQARPGIQNTGAYFSHIWPGIYISMSLSRPVLASVTVANRTCAKALFPTEGATARVEQVAEVPPACRSLVQRKFHGFSDSENDKKTPHYNTEHNNEHFSRSERDVG